MATPENSDRVTNRQLYEELTKLRDGLATKSEMRLTVAMAVLGGNTVAALVLKYTSTAPTVQTAVEHVLRWL